MNFCTLFDSNYISRGLLMIDSLSRVTSDFQFYIFAMDDVTFDILQKLNLKNCTAINISTLEDFELKKIKTERTQVEYCWTCTPVIIDYSLKEFNLNQITYVDADLFFYSNPKILLDEMNDSSILITEHLYGPQYFKAEIFGKFCVQFISFKNDENGLKVLNYWMQSCLDWCYDKIEDGKFGDQKYLDNFEKLFNGIHILKNYGGLLAPWNIQQFKVNEKENKLIATFTPKNKQFEIVFYHFHFIKYYKNNLVDIGDYHLSENIINIFYKNYISELESKSNFIEKYLPNNRINSSKNYLSNYSSKINQLKRVIKGTFNVFPFEHFNLKKFNV